MSVPDSPGSYVGEVSVDGGEVWVWVGTKWESALREQPRSRATENVNQQRLEQVDPAE
jgi:hypothetical protein